MTTPDRIYVTDHGSWHSEQPPVIKTEQYVKVNALLEWLNDQIEAVGNGLLDNLALLALEDVVEHIDEM